MKIQRSAIIISLALLFTACAPRFSRQFLSADGTWWVIDFDEDCSIIEGRFLDRCESCDEEMISEPPIAVDCTANASGSLQFLPAYRAEWYQERGDAIVYIGSEVWRFYYDEYRLERFIRIGPVAVFAEGAAFPAGPIHESDSQSQGEEAGAPPTQPLIGTPEPTVGLSETPTMTPTTTSTPTPTNTSIPYIPPSATPFLPTPTSIPAYDLQADCFKLFGIQGFHFSVIYLWPQHLTSAPITFDAYAGDSGDLSFLASVNVPPLGKSEIFSRNFDSIGSCCRIILRGNNDANPANDSFEWCSP